MALQIPKKEIAPGVLEARNAALTVERELIFGMAKYYQFYRQMRDTICIYDPTTNSYRQDFSIAKYNSLFQELDIFYRRFDHKTDLKDEFGIPRPHLIAYIADRTNRGGLPKDIGEQLVQEITEETEYFDTLNQPQLTALVESYQFTEWLQNRVTQQALTQLNNLKNNGPVTLEQLEVAVATARQSVSIVSSESDLARPIGDFEVPAEGDENELIGPGRFLCRDGLAIIVGPSGIGKSTLAMQMAIALAVGREIFGFKPSRNLKSLIIQGENDDGDIAEMRDGTIAGLGLSEADKITISANVFCCRCNSVTGQKFIQDIVRRNLQRYKPDLLIIDPALCYVGGDTKEQRVVGEFLRTFLLPEIRRAGCGCLLLHHTNKPPSQTPKPGTFNEDAYAEAGSAEFRNVARAAISLRRIGDGSVFELRVPKRGSRLGWKDDLGQPTDRKYIRHSSNRNQLFWEDANEADVKAARAAAEDKKTENKAERILACVPMQGEISQADLFAEAKNHEIGNKACRDAIKFLEAEGSIKCIQRPRAKGPAELLYARVIKTSIPGGGA